MVGIIAVFDYLLGHELSLAVFYAIPVAVVSWELGKNAGILVSVVSAAAVYLADEMARPAIVHPLYPVWEGIASLSTLLLIAWLVATRKQEVERRERLMAQFRESAIVEERNRMACEIHDTLAQGFTGISIQLEAAADILTASPEEARGHIERAHNLARESLGEARRSVWALRPTLLEGEGLVAAVGQFIERIAAGTSIRIEPSVQGTPQPLPSQTEMHLLRICQEATVNALRHADASKIQILLIYGPSKVELCVLDNGRGFDPRACKNDHGFGLTSMRERAERIGAQLTIRSEPGVGTRVVATVPAPVRPSEGSRQ
jgi:signal transduction histidine kinase